MPTVAVIGGGLCGAACAWELSRRGARVIVFEPNAALCGASAVPIALLQPVTGRRGILGRRQIAGFEHTLALARHFLRSSADLRQEGCLRLVRDEHTARVWQKSLRNADPEVAQWLSAQACKLLDAAISPSVFGGAWVPRAVTITISALARELLAGAEATIHQSSVLSITEHADGVVISNEHAEFACDAVVVAAGSATQRLFPAMARSLHGIRGEVVLCEVRCKASASAEQALVPKFPLGALTQILPVGPGRVVLSASFETTETDAVSAAGVAELLAAAQEVWRFPGELVAIGAWSGVRPATADYAPVVGPQHPGSRVHFCTGHSAKGLLLGPISAAWLAHGLLSGDYSQIPSDWLPYSAA